MKKVWQKPILEILEVNMTMAASTNPSTLDATYTAGTAYNSQIWSS